MKVIIDFIVDAATAVNIGYIGTLITLMICNVITVIILFEHCNI